MKLASKAEMQNRSESRESASSESRAPLWAWCLLAVWLIASMAGIGVLQRQDVLAGAVCFASDKRYGESTS